MLTTSAFVSLAFMLSGCGLSLGPQTHTEYVIPHAGRPMQVLENSSLKGRVLDGTGDAVQQDVGGWVFMPLDHWESVKKALEKGATK